MDQFQESVMIALLPTTSEWCHIDLPHMTLVYVGEIPDLPPTLHNVIAKQILSIALACSTLTLDVLGLELFGDNKDTEVFTLGTNPQLLAMRAMVEQWNASEYEFNPHVTIGPIGSFAGNQPMSITFDRVAVSWGEDLLEFKFIS